MSVQTTLDGKLAKDVVQGKWDVIRDRRRKEELRLPECEALSKKTFRLGVTWQRLQIKEDRKLSWERTKRRELTYCRPPPQKYTPDTDLDTVVPPRPFVRDPELLAQLKMSMTEAMYERFRRFNMNPRRQRERCDFMFIYPEDVKTCGVM